MQSLHSIKSCDMQPGCGKSQTPQPPPPAEQSEPTILELWPKARGRFDSDPINQPRMSRGGSRHRAK